MDRRTQHTGGRRARLGDARLHDGGILEASQRSAKNATVHTQRGLGMPMRTSALELSSASQTLTNQSFVWSVSKGVEPGAEVATHKEEK